jgi:hypothetical protein
MDIPSAAVIQVVAVAEVDRAAVKGAGGTARGRPAYVRTIPHMLSVCSAGAR